MYGMTSGANANVNAGTIFELTLPPANVTWGQTGGGSWNNIGNWAGNIVPGTNAKDTAKLGTAIGSSMATVTLDGSWTIASLGFNTTGGGSYVISRSAGDSTSALTLTGTGASFSLTDSGGNQTIAAPVVLGSNLSVSAATGSSLTLSAAVSETSAGKTVTLAGGGKLILSGSNTYSGLTTISTGTLQVGSGGTTGSIDPTSGVTDNGVLAFSRSGSVTFSKIISGGGNVTMLGPGTLVLSASDTYTGGTTVGGGTLQLGNAAAIGSTSGAATISSGVLDLHGYSLGVGALSGTGTINNLSGSGTYTLTVGNGNASSTFSGGIKNTTGAIALSKTGTGTLILAGANTYTGGTKVSGGTLDFSTPAATPSEGIVTVTGGGRVVLGALLTASAPSVSSDSDLAAADTAATTSPATAGGAVATGGGGPSPGGTDSMAEGAATAAVPEPSTFALLGVAAIGLLGYASRRKRT